MKKIVNAMIVGLGFIFLGLGTVGVALPLLPSTPFFMLAAVCFAKGSERFHRWFTKTKLYLKYVEPAVKSRVMEKQAKRKTMAMLCLIFFVSFFFVPMWHVKAVILAVALLHFYYFLFKVKTLPAKEV